MALDAIKRIRILLERGEGDFKIGHIRSADVAKVQTRVFAGW
jgi:isochorismate synthase EntC